MTDLDLDLQRQLRRWADDLASQVPPYRRDLFRHHRAPATRHRSLWIVVAAVTVAVAIGAALLWRAGTDSSGRVATQGAPFTVLHERIDYRIWAELSCPAIDASDAFDRAIVDVWADKAGHRYRSRFTYPDGSTHDVIAIGSPYFPTELYEQGTARLGQKGCAAEPGFAAGGDGSRVYSLNPLAEIPKFANGDPQVIGLRDTSTPVAGDYIDSLGRPAQLREARITGFHSGPTATDRPLVQTTQVFVDPATGQINEATFTDDIEGLGRVGWISTRTLSITEPATDELFGHDGYTQLPAQPPPTDARPPATIK